MQKRVRFIATHRHLVDAVDRQHEHEKKLKVPIPQHPRLTLLTWEMPLSSLSRAEGRGRLWFEACLGNFHSKAFLLFVDAKRSDLWRPLFPLVEEILARKVQSIAFLDPATELYNQISELVPSQIANIQISHLPRAKWVRPGLRHVTGHPSC